MAGVSHEVRIALIEADIVRYPESVQEHYRALVSSGATPMLAQMLATRVAPMQLRSNRSFNEAQRRNMNSKGRYNLNRIVSIAENAGISTQGKYYVGGLGRYTDPHAWVSTADDVLTVCRQRNLNCTGAVNHKATPVDPPPTVPLAPDLVESGVRRELAADPATAEKARKNPKVVRELREKVVAKHGRRKAGS